MSTIRPSEPSAESTTTQSTDPNTTKPKQPKGFRKRAVCAAPAVIIAALAVFFLLTRGLFQSVESKVQSAVQQVRNIQHFPVQVDSVTSLTGVKPEGDAIRFDYLISSSADPSTFNPETIRSSVIPKACSVEMKDVMDAGIKLKYAYTFEGTSKSADFTVTKADCATS